MINKYILDTCVVIWIFNDAKKISKRAFEIIENTNTEKYVSMISIFEIANVNIKGKNDVIGSDVFNKSMVPAFQKLNIKILEFDLEFLQNKFINFPIVKINGKPHKDPFDRALIAQAEYNNFIAISPDEKWPSYKNVKILW